MMKINKQIGSAFVILIFSFACRTAEDGKMKYPRFLTTVTGYSLPEEGDRNVLLGAYSRAELPTSNIKVLVWNIYKGNKGNWAGDFHRLVKPADLAIIQEVYLDTNMKNIFNKLEGRGWQVGVSFYMDGEKKISTGVSTSAFVDPNSINLLASKDREPIIHTPKMALFTSYPIAGYAESLLVLNPLY